MATETENTLLKYKTGDLFLANRHTLTAILNRAIDPIARWSDIGMFIVNPSSPESIKVMLLTSEGLIIEELNELLRDPTIQAAAHRSLTKSAKSSTSRFIIEYLKILGEHEDKIRAIYPETFLLGDAKLLSSAGSRIDSRGRDIRISGFTKGDPNSRLKSHFTPADLIGSILAHAKLLKYDPDIKISDFQHHDGLLDDYYSAETPLLPNHKLDDDDIEEVLTKARIEAENLIMAHIRKFPVMNYKRLVAQGNGSSMRLHDQDGQEELDEEEILRYVATYPEQESNPMSMAGIHNRKLDTVAKGEEAESTAIEKRIRQKEKALSQHSKPTPKYK